VAFLGALKAGATYVPIDPASPPDRAARILADARVSAVITDGDARAIAAAGERPVISVGTSGPPPGDTEHVPPRARAFRRT
jgi:non-ribosomal peptide synthetase component F